MMKDNQECNGSVGDCEIVSNPWVDKDIQCTEKMPNITIVDNSFKKQTKKILDFFDDKKLQKIFEHNFIHKQEVKKVIENIAVELCCKEEDIEHHTICDAISTALESLGLEDDNELKHTCKSRYNQFEKSLNKKNKR